MEAVSQAVNVSPSSTHGHFVRKAKNVIKLDDVTEAFYVEGESVLTTNNHTTLNMKDNCLINCQVVYNPFSKMHEKSRD
jgi:hypothetical protein